MSLRVRSADELRVGCRYRVVMRNNRTGQIGSFVGFTDRGMATLQFTKGISWFKATSLSWESNAERERNRATDAGTERAGSRNTGERTQRAVANDNRREAAEREATEELCKAFQNTLRIALDRQRERILREVGSTVREIHHSAQSERKEQAKRDAEVDKALQEIKEHLFEGST